MASRASTPICPWRPPPRACSGAPAQPWWRHHAPAFDRASMPSALPRDSAPLCRRRRSLRGARWRSAPSTASPSPCSAAVGSLPRALPWSAPLHTSTRRRRKAGLPGGVFHPLHCQATRKMDYPTAVMRNTRVCQVKLGDTRPKQRKRPTSGRTSSIAAPHPSRVQNSPTPKSLPHTPGCTVTGAVPSPHSPTPTRSPSQLTPRCRPLLHDTTPPIRRRPRPSERALKTAASRWPPACPSPTCPCG